MQIMAEISGRGAVLLSAIRARRGEWINRADLATDTGKRLLSPNDRNWLERLERDGLIEVDKRAVPGPVGWEWVYRIKENA